MLVTLKAMKNIISMNADNVVVSSEVREVLTAYDWGEFNVSFRKYLEQNKIDYDYIVCENLEQEEELLSD